MSALQKIAGSISNIPSSDLRVVSQMSALFILPTNLRALTHPPLEQRLARLAKMSRELGKPDPPLRAATATSKLGLAVTAFVVVFVLVVAVGLLVLR
jgi:hypothetical protein